MYLQKKSSKYILSKDNILWNFSKRVLEKEFLFSEDQGCLFNESHSVQSIIISPEMAAKPIQWSNPSAAPKCIQWHHKCFLLTNVLNTEQDCYGPFRWTKLWTSCWEIWTMGPASPTAARPAGLIVYIWNQNSTTKEGNGPKVATGKRNLNPKEQPVTLISHCHTQPPPNTSPVPTCVHFWPQLPLTELTGCVKGWGEKSWMWGWGLGSPISCSLALTFFPILRPQIQAP